jgi:hypothetical protein
MRALVATVFVLAVCGASAPLVPLEAPASTSFGSVTASENGTATTGGCRSVAAFTTNAVPELQKDGCLECHAGDSHPAATAALDLTKVGLDNIIGCRQALTKVNLANKPLSAIIQAPAGAQAHMGGKVPDKKEFTAALLVWLDNE